VIDIPDNVGFSAVGPVGCDAGGKMLVKTICWCHNHITKLKG